MPIFVFYELVLPITNIYNESDWNVHMNEILKELKVECL